MLQPLVPQDVAEYNPIDDQQQQPELQVAVDLIQDAPVDDEVDKEHGYKPKEEPGGAANVVKTTLLPPELHQFLVDVSGFRHR